MLMAADLSRRLGIFEQSDLDRIKSLLIKPNLPVKIHKDVQFEKIYENMKIDKKSKEGILHLVLLKNIGEAFLTSEYSDELLKETIESFL